jgi:hypothetical protein
MPTVSSKAVFEGSGICRAAAPLWHAVLCICPVEGSGSDAEHGGVAAFAWQHFALTGLPSPCAAFSRAAPWAVIWRPFRASPSRRCRGLTGRDSLVQDKAL